jgi:type IV pilus assembly protein PilW
VNRQRGATLVEMMVAVAISLVLTLAVATLHARVLGMADATGRAGDAQDTLRVGLAILEYELQHAGYWGLVTDPARVEGRRAGTAPLAVPVMGDCGPGWTIDLDWPVEAWSGGWPLACAPFGGVAPLGAVLVLRRVDTEATEPDAGLIQLHANPWEGRLHAAGEAALPGDEVRDIVARAYYVSPRATGDPTRPSLRRKTLQRGPRVIDEEILPGIAGLSIELGVDTDPPGSPGAGQANRFGVPEVVSGVPVAVRITLHAEQAGLSLTRTVPLRNAWPR